MDITPRIAVFDSGIGGTGVLDQIRARAPWADLVYVADHAFGAYGERSLDDVRERTEVLARFLATCGVQIVVVACNSASAAALHHLRRVLPHIAFVGMEPAIKPAVETTTSGVIGVLATEATFQGELFGSLVDAHAEGVEVVRQACPGLAAAVEGGVDPAELLDLYLPPIVDAGADVVVLGCTHYPLIADQIAARLPAGVVLVDPAPAVAAQATNVAGDIGVDLHGVGSTLWWSTAARPRLGEADWQAVDIPVGSEAAIRVGETTMSAVVGDITLMDVDAIVNAANIELAHGGGVALAIAQAGGPSILEESALWIEQYGPLEPGIAALTSAGEMPASYVLHVAGPIYEASQDNEALLAAATFAALDLASEVDATTIAIPAISSGTYGYPPDEAAVVIAETAAEYVSDEDPLLRSVRLVGYDSAMARGFGAALNSLGIEA